VQTFEKQSKEKFAYKNVYCFYNFGFALEFQWTLGDKHQQEKIAMHALL